MIGYIKLHRKFVNNPIFASKEKATRRDAWINLLMRANWQDNRIMFDGNMIDVERGSFISSEVKLAEEWLWSRTKTRKFLRVLEQEGMLTKKRTGNGTTFSIANYREYQGDFDTAQDTAKKTAKMHPNGQLKNTDKEVKNIKNINNKKEDASNKIDANLKSFIINWYESRVKGQRAIDYLKNPKALIVKSADTIEKLVRIDGYSMEDVLGTLTWAKDDDFWGKNVISIASARNKTRSGSMKFESVFAEFYKSKDESPEAFKERMRRETSIG